MQKILRLREDCFAFRKGDYNATKLYKRDMLREVASPKDGQVLVKLLGDAESPPTYVPQYMVFEAGPGMYRAKRRFELKYHRCIPEGDILRVTQVNKILDMFLPCGVWAVKLLDVSGQITYCDPAVLEPIDSPDAQTIDVDVATISSKWAASRKELFNRECWL